MRLILRDNLLAGSLPEHALSLSSPPSEATEVFSCATSFVDIQYGSYWPSLYDSYRRVRLFAANGLITGNLETDEESGIIDPDSVYRRRNCEDSVSAGCFRWKIRRS